MLAAVATSAGGRRGLLDLPVTVEANDRRRAATSSKNGAIDAMP
jgi:hypothetical protein